jgi:hypothetical protein
MIKKIVFLENELELMINASSVLNYSYSKCEKIGIKENYNQIELDAFENLTSRFARLNDIIIQKILRTIHSIDLDEIGSVRDSINLAEKKILIESASTMIEMRELRNSIAHEYLPNAIRLIFVRTLELTPSLLKNAELINLYCRKKYLENI